MRFERSAVVIPALLKASLLIALYSIRSERQFCERLRYDCTVPRCDWLARREGFEPSTLRSEV